MLFIFALIVWFGGTIVSFFSSIISFFSGLISIFWSATIPMKSFMLAILLGGIYLIRSKIISKPNTRRPNRRDDYFNK